MDENLEEQNVNKKSALLLIGMMVGCQGRENDMIGVIKKLVLEKPEKYEVSVAYYAGIVDTLNNVIDSMGAACHALVGADETERLLEKVSVACKNKLH